MFKYTRRVISNYFYELSKVDFANFNQFIFNQILKNLMKFNTILPIMAAIAVIAFIFSLQDSFYVFIPQSNITSFAMYMLFACVASLLLLILYPLVIIFVINYIAHKLRVFVKSWFLPLKILCLGVAFYFCIKLLTLSTVFTM